MKVPRVPGSAGMGVSSSGKLEESRPWSLFKWLLLFPLGVAATLLFVPLLFTELLWFALAAVFLGLIYKTWRR